MTTLDENDAAVRAVLDEFLPLATGAESLPLVRAMAIQIALLRSFNAEATKESKRLQQVTREQHAELRALKLVAASTRDALAKFVAREAEDDAARIARAGLDALEAEDLVVSAETLHDVLGAMLARVRKLQDGAE